IPAFVEAAARGDVDLAAQNRIQPALACVVVKNHRREHVPVLGDRNRRHLQLHRLVEQLVDPACAVEQGELGVQVEMDEFSHASRSTLKPQRALRSQRAIVLSAVSASSAGSAFHVSHSHSMVDGGFEEISYTTRLIPLTSLTMRD